MSRITSPLGVTIVVALAAVGALATRSPEAIDTVIVNRAIAQDVSASLSPAAAARAPDAIGSHGPAPTQPQGVDAEQRSQGTRPPATLAASFDGLGIGFNGPQGPGRSGNPSDNSLAVGPNHIVQTVNSRMAIFTKKGTLFDTTGRVLYGSVSTNNVFRGFSGTCEARNNGDAVVRYDQLADRWLIVMPIFSRAAHRPDQPSATSPLDPAAVSVPGVAGQPGPAAPLFQPPPPDAAALAAQQGRGGRGGGRGAVPEGQQGVYAMCYAVSTSPDPLGAYHRYEFLRPLFPDYPRPAIWPDGITSRRARVTTVSRTRWRPRGMPVLPTVRRCWPARQPPSSA